MNRQLDAQNHKAEAFLKWSGIMPVSLVRTQKHPWVDPELIKGLDVRLDRFNRDHGEDLRQDALISHCRWSLVVKSLKFLFDSSGDPETAGWAVEGERLSPVILDPTLVHQDDFKRALEVEFGVDLQDVDFESIPGAETITPENMVCVATIVDNKETIARLLGDDPTLVNTVHQDSPYRHSLLGTACEKGYENLTEFLIDQGADIDYQNIRGETPMKIAASLGYADLVALLIEKGASMDLADTLGETALHAAARHADLETVDMLIEHGVDLYARNKDGQTALDIVYDWEKLGSSFPQKVIDRLSVEMSGRSLLSTAPDRRGASSALGQGL